MSFDFKKYLTTKSRHDTELTKEKTELFYYHFLRFFVSVRAFVVTFVANSLLILKQLTTKPLRYTENTKKGFKKGFKSADLRKS